MQDLVPATLLRRYKRFLVDCRLGDGTLVTAHCANTGSMKTLLGEGRPARLRRSEDPRRKLPFSLVLLGVGDGSWALVDTSLPNRIVAEGHAAGRIAEFDPGALLRREPRLPGGRRLDLLLEPGPVGGPATYVEIKNVTMKSARAAGRADFPDAVTKRGRAHLEELAALADRGERAVQFFLLGRSDCDRVGIAEEIDPGYAAALREAMARGVEVLAYGLDLASGAIRLGARVPFEPR